MSTKNQIIARFNVAEGLHTVELAETPKGLVQASIDGHPMSHNETKELAMWLNMVTHSSKEKE
jgi:hypothetical protein